MTGKISTVLSAIVISGLLIACSKAPPKCGDDETIELARKIILEQVGGLEGYASEKEIQDNIKIELPRAKAYDGKIKKYSCAAQLEVVGLLQLPITYESQLDDNGQHVVSFGGIRRGDLSLIQSGLLQSILQSRPKK